MPLPCASVPAGPSRRLFDAWARVYDAPIVQRLTYRPVHDAILRALEAAPPGRVLDLACGTGLLAARLRRALPAARLVGCDFSREMLRRAAARTADVAWIRADAARLPLADEAFDAVVCTEALHWFPDQAAALAECRRVLRPGGRVLVALVTVPAEGMGRLFHGLSLLAGQPFRWPTRAGLRRLLARAGFEVAGERRILRIPGGLIVPPVLAIGVRPGRR